MPREAEDLTGRRFGKLVVVGQAPPKGNSARWVCKCDCGSDHEVAAKHLKSGATQSCGCIVKASGWFKRADHTGERFGQLVAEKYIGARNGSGLWRCRCDCGATTDVLAGNLVSGNTQSCGHTKRSLFEGETYGCWTVQRRVGTSRDGAVRWAVECSTCGAQAEATTRDLRRGSPVCRK